MPSRAEVLGNRTIRRQKALGVAGGFEPLPATLALTRRPMRVLTPVVEVATLAMFHTGQDLALGRPIALQLIGDHHPRRVVQAFEPLAEELLGRLVVASTLHQEIESIPVLIHCPPEVMPLPVDREEDFVQMPRVA
jgi:hypothetical protein